MNTETALTPELLDRYCAVALPDLAAGMWHQKDPGSEFFRKLYQGGMNVIEGHILGRHWVACRASADASIEWLSFDLDAKSHDDDPWERYLLLRRIMGQEHVPLVYRTPSGGLRVRYRIPTTPIRELIVDRTRGLVADVLRGGGLCVRSGYVEVFPQPSQPDRLPLGTGMSLLEPDTLEVVAGCELQEAFNLPAFIRALDLLEEWYANPIEGLLHHLSNSPRCGPVRLVSDEESSPMDEAHFVRASDGTVRLGPKSTALVNAGLVTSSSRFFSEFAVGMAMAISPEEFRPYGLGKRSTPREHALAIARWLSEHHNGYSQEWHASRARHGSTEAAVEEFAARYLEPTSGTGLNMIDRIMRAVHAVDPNSHRIRQLTREEWATIFGWADKHFKPGSDRLKFEVWTGALFRALKEVIRYHEGQVVEPNAPRRFVELDDGFGSEWLQVELSAEWQESWPYGSGGHGRRTPYLRYRAVLEGEGVLQKVAAHLSPGGRHRHAPDDARGEASLFIIRRPSDATIGDVPVPPWLLKHACSGITVARRACTLDHAYHALAATRSSEDLRKRYGYSASVNLRERANLLRSSVKALLTDPSRLLREGREGTCTSS